ncbi:tonB-system energizer ExbB [Pseudomonas antarctica]|uniref:Biopolymer transport protein ExbB n=2 Tax=Pseudomonas TaxID=286 RepID=A0A1G9VY45_9PSED|nr:tonB-system energizer ExbB [Pseudomonas antarctica]KAF2409102.1 biopolymer transport protein ExbB [Pseudomonas antarctica]SDM76836.1 biopolymer transport protein ExbB [Pseudomonas antarctica]
MTRNTKPASPTKLHSPSRAWRAIAALLFSVMLAPTAALADNTAPSAAPANTAQAPAAPVEQMPVPKNADGTVDMSKLPPEVRDAVDGINALGEEAQAEQDNSLGMAHDLSPWGMYQNADVVVKAVMIGLAIASIITWTIWIAKGFELLGAKRRLRTEIVHLKKATTLKEASDTATKKGTLANLLVHDALEEMRLSVNTREKEGIKERVSFRLERLVAACGRNMSSGTGVLATIGSTAPFVGLFGTVWGIMNSFIGIAKTQTTNLAVVAPGIAEALLATALGLVAAIPAVVIYNVFARSIAGYKAQVSDASAEVLLLVSRDLDHLPTERSSQPHMVKVG